MRFRAFISILAAIGVLLHAGLVVRHNSIMLGLALQPAHSAQTTIICHGDGLVTVADDFGLPGEKPAKQQKTACPVCTGLMPALALLASFCGDIARPTMVLAHHKPAAVQSAVLRHVVYLPPSRAPPLAI
jgi:hypothetical protein